MAPTKVSSLYSFPPVSVSRPPSTVLQRQTPLSSLFSSLLCSACSTLRLGLLRNGYAQTTIYSRTEVLHSATVCRMCRLILKGLETKFCWMERCGIGSPDAEEHHTHDDADSRRRWSDAGSANESSKSIDSSGRGRLDSCTLPRGAIIHIKAQASIPGLSESPHEGIESTTRGALANVGGLGVEVVVFGSAAVELLPEENLCVWHLAERRRKQKRFFATTPVPDRTVDDTDFGYSEHIFHDARAPTPPPKDVVFAAGRLTAKPTAQKDNEKGKNKTKKKGRSANKISRNTAFQLARQWLLEMSLTPSSQRLIPVERGGPSDLVPPQGFPSFLIDVSYPPRLLLVRTASIVAERGKVPRYAVLNHCSNVPIGVGLDDGIGSENRRLTIDPARTSKAVNWSALPVLFQHAALAARALKLRYLWIHEMCPSFSGNFSGSHEHGDNLGFVFAHAFLTMAVHSPAAINGFLGKDVAGFYDTKTASRLSYTDFITSVEMESRLAITPLGLLARITSPNILHFAPGRIYFEDCEGVRSPAVEGIRLKNLGPGTMTRFPISFEGAEKHIYLDRVARRTEGMVPVSFGGVPGRQTPFTVTSELIDVLERFSGCLAGETGRTRLSVLEGLLRMTDLDKEGTMLSGIWASTSGIDPEPGVPLRPNTHIAKSLMWKSVFQPARKTGNRLVHDPRDEMLPPPLPSWSWVSVSEQIEYSDSVLMPQNGKGEVWLFGADNGLRAPKITLEYAYDALDGRMAQVAERPPRMDSLGTHDLHMNSPSPWGRRSTSSPFSTYPCSGTDRRAVCHISLNQRTSRLTLAGVLIPVRLSRRCFGKEWLRQDRVEEEYRDSTEQDESGIAEYPTAPISPGPNSLSPESGDVYRRPFFETSRFPSHLGPPSQSAYRGVYGTTSSASGRYSSEILIGWCGVDDERGCGMDDLWMRRRAVEDDLEPPELAVLHLIGGYGLLVRRTGKGGSAPQAGKYRDHEDGHRGSRAPSRTEGDDDLPSPSPNGRCMYSRLAAGRMGKTLSLARIRQEMEQRRRDREGGGRTPVSDSGRQSSASMFGADSAKDLATGHDAGASEFPVYTRIGFVKLDDRLVDRSLYSDAAAPRLCRDMGCPTFGCTSNSRSTAATATAAASEKSKAPPVSSSAAEFPDRRSLWAGLDRLVRRRLEVPERMNKVGARGFVVSLV